MDNSLRTLCEAIKKILAQLKPQTNELSYLLMTGVKEQGKSSLLKQSGFSEIPVLSEQHARIYYNQQGIILELGESWFAQSTSLLTNTLKSLNKCNKYLQISGLIACVDINEIISGDPEEQAAQKKTHLQFLERIAGGLGYHTELALIFTKMDTLAGFTEFYQTEHAMDLAKPLGFSLECAHAKKMATFTLQFEQLIELLSQKVINKIHPVRSTVKRSLIREFPLQLANIQNSIQGLIAGVSLKKFNLHSIYFTSAEQGGVSVDRLNKKIQHEYALIVQDSFPQATNFRAYFVEGALKSIQAQCAQVPTPQKKFQKPALAVAASVASVCLLYLVGSYFKTVKLLNETNQELVSYDQIIQQKANDSQALYHLSKAANSMEHVASNAVSMPAVSQLKSSLHQQAQHRLQEEFMPSLLNDLEEAISSPTNAPEARYKALKIYLMLDQSQHFSASPIQDWFSQRWNTQNAKTVKQKLALLNHLLEKPLQHIQLKQQVISDARNYLNALPASYLYYSLAKEYFPVSSIPLSMQGFQLAASEMPAYFTKNGFDALSKDLVTISKTLDSENWVLERQDLGQLENKLQEAYHAEYVSFWRNMMQKSKPLNYQNFQEGRELAKSLYQSDALIKLVQLIQEQTKPDLSSPSSAFNQAIAKQFTEFNLMSLSNAGEFNNKFRELEQFISTLSVVNDSGKTAFNITKARFNNENNSDPISALFNQAKQSPEPLKSWANQIAGDAFALLIKDSRLYINHQWQQTAYKTFQSTIANRYPFDSNQVSEITMDDFNRFFSTHGVLNQFTEEYIKPFLDVSNAQWTPKAVNEYVLPVSTDALDAIIRANIITNMFYPNGTDESHIEFSLQKLSLDPVVSSLKLEIGRNVLEDTQGSESFIRFNWPQSNAKLALNSIEGHHYELSEQGTWALFKLLEKVNVLIDEQDSSSLQILFEINSNSGRYLLKTQNKVNPFTPGILNGFRLNEALV